MESFESLNNLDNVFEFGWNASITPKHISANLEKIMKPVIIF